MQSSPKCLAWKIHLKIAAEEEQTLPVGINTVQVIVENVNLFHMRHFGVFIWVFMWTLEEMDVKVLLHWF